MELAFNKIGGFFKFTLGVAAGIALIAFTIGAILL
jgi:hypothetical protein